MGFDFVRCFRFFINLGRLEVCLYCIVMCIIGDIENFIVLMGWVFIFFFLVKVVFFVMNWLSLIMVIVLL